jgi:hypothetical protein
MARRGAESTLTIKEINFLKAYMRTGILSRAYREVFPKSTIRSSECNCCTFYKRIKEKIGAPALLEYLGLTDQLITKTMVKHVNSKNEVISNNATQFAAKMKQLLSEKKEIDLRHSGRVSIADFLADGEPDDPDDGECDDGLGVRDE